MLYGKYNQAKERIHFNTNRNFKLKLKKSTSILVVQVLQAFLIDSNDFKS